MSSKPTASMMERRHPETTHIDSLATLDMLTLLHKDDKRIADAVEACLPAIARLMDNATATLSRGGRLVIVGAGASGQAAAQAVNEFTPEGNIRWSPLSPEERPPRGRRWKPPRVITILELSNLRLCDSATRICCWR